MIIRIKAKTHTRRDRRELRADLPGLAPAGIFSPPGNRDVACLYGLLRIHTMMTWRTPPSANQCASLRSACARVSEYSTSNTTVGCAGSPAAAQGTKSYSLQCDTHCAIQEEQEKEETTPALQLLPGGATASSGHNPLSASREFPGER